MFLRRQEGLGAEVITAVVNVGGPPYPEVERRRTKVYDPNPELACVGMKS